MPAWMTSELRELFCAGADALGRFGHQDLMAAGGQGARDGQADHAGADDDAIDVGAHGDSLSWKRRHAAA